MGAIRCIKDEEGKVLSEDVVIKERWQRFFAKLLNKEWGETTVVGAENVTIRVRMT